MSFKRSEIFSIGLRSETKMQASIRSLLERQKPEVGQRIVPFPRDRVIVVGDLHGDGRVFDFIEAFFQRLKVGK